ncbi:MAG: AEC family transporter [Desulfobacterales bacterium]
MGYACRQLGFPGDEFWGAAERMTYFVFFPALLVDKLAFASFAASTALPMAASIMATILVLSAGLFLFRPRRLWSGPTFSSVFQGSIRFNTFVGLAAVSAITGQSGVTLAAVAIIAMIPLINLFCVPTVAYFGQGRGAGLLQMIIEILRNPLILACMAGFTRIREKSRSWSKRSKRPPARLPASGITLPQACLFSWFCFTSTMQESSLSLLSTTGVSMLR